MAFGGCRAHAGCIGDTTYPAGVAKMYRTPTHLLPTKSAPRRPPRRRLGHEAKMRLLFEHQYKCASCKEMLPPTVRQAPLPRLRYLSAIASG